MATTFVEYTGDGNATKQFTFPSYQESDVKVRVDGVLKTTSTHYNITGYTTTGGGNVVFTSGNIPSSPAKIRIYRDTNVDAAKATYTAGSSVKAADLNNNNTQLLYRAQEEQIPNLIQSYDIADQAIETSDIKDLAVTRPKIAADAIDGTKIADDSVDSEHYVALSIDTEHIANEQVTTAKLAPDAVVGSKLADNAVDSEHYTDGSIDREHLAADIVDGTKIADDSINSEHYVDLSIDTQHIGNLQVTTNKIADGAITDAKIAGGSLDNRYYTETELDNGQLDNRYYTEAESDARYFNISTGDTIKDGDVFPDNDTTIATTAAINDRIIDLVDDVGGFVPIANETSFPTANPDVNNGSGTLVSIKAIASTRTPSSGTVTIANGAGSNTVTITGCGSTVLSAGFGVIVETTTTLHTYAFHRLVPKATEVTTVASKATEVTTVHTNINNVNTVATDIANVNTTAGDIANVNTTAGNIANVNTVASNIANVNTTAGSIANVNTTAGSIANVNTTATNIASVNNASANINAINKFGDTYQVASSAPSTDGGGNALAAGDLYFDTTSNELRVHNGTTFQGGVTATGNLAGLGSNTFTGNQTIQSTDPQLIFTDTNNNSDYKIKVDGGNFNIVDTTNSNANRITLQSDGTVDIASNLNANSGLDVTGNITVTGNVDGRDVAADGNKLDGISTGATRDLLQDVTPQLGGNLDVNGKKINTAISNGNIQIEPDGTGVVEIRGAGGNDGTLQLNCSVQSHGIKLKSPPHSAGASYTLTFPNSLTANGVLTTNSSGTLNAALLSNVNVDASAAIAGTKISPNFGSQNIVTTGTLDVGLSTLNRADITVVTDGSRNNGVFINPGDTGQGNRPNIHIKGAGSAGLSQEAIQVFYDNGSTKSFELDYAGNIEARDLDVRHADFSAGIDVTGNITVTGTVDGIDLQTLNSAVSANTAKVSNATHTGDVTGATSLTIANNAVTTDKIADEAVTLAKLPHGTSSNDGKFLRANNGADPTFETINNQTLQFPSGATGVTCSTENEIQINSSNYKVVFDTDTTNTHEISFAGPSSLSKTSAYTLPEDGSNGQFLKTNGSGVLSFDTIDLTALSASNLTSGTIPDARFPATLPAISGANLTGVASTTAGGAIYENSQTISATHTIPVGSNGMSAGPVTINNGVTLTISNGSTYTIV